MVESSPSRRSSGIGAVWLALFLCHVVLESLAPRGVSGDGLLPMWARLSLLATEGTELFFLVLGGAAAFELVGWVFDRGALRVPWVPSVLRGLLLGGVLLGLAASWGSFWLSGQFLDRQGLEFAGSNLGTVLGYAVRVHPFLVYGLPGVLLAASVALCVTLPRALRRLAPGGALWFARAWIGVLGLALVAVACGEIAHRRRREKIIDPATGAVFSQDDLYRLRRERTAGPLTHLLARCLKPADPLGDDAGAPPAPIVRRPIESMEAYLAGVDRRNLHPWNVVVVLVDSLRADQLRATGGPREVMPVLEALAREGRVFTDCVAQASHTDYSAPSVFSSHYPLRARDVYRYPKDPPYPRVMIYDVLKALGWRTALFSSQNEEWGQMTNYLQTGGLDVLVHAASAGSAGKPGPDRPAFAGDVDDSITVSGAQKWVDAAPETPFFLYLNLQNSHLPYEVPLGFHRPFGPDTIDFKISIGWFPQDKAAIVKERYADSLAYVDGLLGRFFQHLRDLGQWDRTLVVVTGDHGEAFYEHGTAAHANGVHEEVIRVPLVVHAPGLAPGADGRPAELLDIAPGVFHLLGLPVHPSFQGEDLFASGPNPERARYMISDTPWKTQLGVVRKGFKLIRDGDTGACILYDLARDPAEKHDATGSNPQIARDLKGRLSAWRRAQLDYYENPLRQKCEYPPVLRD